MSRFSNFPCQLKLWTCKYKTETCNYPLQLPQTLQETLDLSFIFFRKCLRWVWMTSKTKNRIAREFLSWHTLEIFRGQENLMPNRTRITILYHWREEKRRQMFGWIWDLGNVRWETNWLIRLGKSSKLMSHEHFTGGVSLSLAATLLSYILMAEAREKKRSYGKF